MDSGYKAIPQQMEHLASGLQGLWIKIKRFDAFGRVLTNSLAQPEGQPI
ncbi:MAG: hypothetical protein ACKESC_00425 [Candidatus Hodgkinia cicadicola]